MAIAGNHLRIKADPKLSGSDAGLGVEILDLSPDFDSLVRILCGWELPVLQRESLEHLAIG